MVSGMVTQLTFQLLPATQQFLLQVVEQNGQWYCEYDGKTYPSMVRRYVTTIRCTDSTAELTLNAFNEQVGIVTVL